MEVSSLPSKSYIKTMSTNKDSHVGSLRSQFESLTKKPDNNTPPKRAPPKVNLVLTEAKRKVRNSSCSNHDNEKLKDHEIPGSKASSKQEGYFDLPINTRKSVSTHGETMNQTMARLSDELESAHKSIKKDESAALQRLQNYVSDEARTNEE